MVLVSTLGGSGRIERTDFGKFSLWKYMVDVKGLILDHFYFRR